MPGGAAVTSDPVAMPVAPLAKIAISMYFAHATPMPTIHELSRQTTYIAAGNQLSTASLAGPVADQRQSYYGLGLVETSSKEMGKVVVLFGDSITDGQHSTIDAAKRYPDQLDDRLKAAGFTRIGIVNAGISGNRWLHDVWGPSGTSRFKRDVLDVAGVTSTIILLGINDIGFSSQPVTAAQITRSMSTAISAAKAKGIKVFMGTLLPYKGASYYSAAGEAKREAVNQWIRSNKNIDGVVDFDRLMQSPADPLTINPVYNSGDDLHPNDAGYAAMAAAIDLATLQ
ncbi:MAG: SGNH/GDSL hydrolase family protein [Rhodanobacter sp.]